MVSLARTVTGRFFHHHRAEATAAPDSGGHHNEDEEEDHGSDPARCERSEGGGGAAFEVVGPRAIPHEGVAFTEHTECERCVALLGDDAVREGVAGSEHGDRSGRGAHGLLDECVGVVTGAEAGRRSGCPAEVAVHGDGCGDGAGAFRRPGARIRRRRSRMTPGAPALAMPSVRARSCRESGSTSTRRAPSRANASTSARRSASR